jgi:hypothetical protein
MPDALPPTENINSGVPHDQDAEGLDRAVELFMREGREAPTPQRPPEPLPQSPPPTAEPEDEPVVPPKPVVEGDKVEPEVPDAELAAAEKPPEFVKFTTPEQQQRFNKMFGYAKRLERELAMAREAAQRQPAPPAYQPPQQPQYSATEFTEKAPKLKDFEDPDVWAEANANWTVRKAKHEARMETEQLLARRLEVDQAAQHQRMQQQHEERKLNAGYAKYGQIDFDDASNDLATVVTQPMRNTLFQLDHFEDVVVHLGKNLQEAERIARLPFLDQAYELKSLDRRLSAKVELQRKEVQPKPTPVEKPGQGEPAQKTNVTQKMRVAKDSGDLRDWAKVIQEMGA